MDSKSFSQALEHLLKASSKSIAEKCLNLVFISRNEISATECKQTIAELLELEVTQANELYLALSECIQVTLYHTASPLESLAELFQEKAPNVNTKLKQLIGQILNSRLGIYKEGLELSRVSYPKLVDIDWSINIKKSSSEIVDMNVPSVSLQLSVNPQPTNSNTLQGLEKFTMELNKENLDTMLEGLGKIRDQLSAMS